MKKWIERYLYQIEKKLPQKNKKDLIEEIRSNLYDELEASYHTPEPTEEQIIDYLKNNGSPNQIASAYRGREESLIGGNLYPIYLLIIKIALLASLLGITIATILTLRGQGGTALDTLWSYIESLFQAAIGAVGSVTVIFALIQRFMDPDELTLEASEWNPKDLPAIPEKKNKLKRSDPIVALVFLTLLMVVVNVFPNLIIWGVKTDSSAVIVPVLNRNVFLGYLPWLNLLWGTTIIFNIVLLVKNQWSVLLRLFKIGLDWAGLGLLFWMLSNPTLFAFQSGFFAWIGVDNGTQLDSLFTTMIRVGIGFILVLTVFETGKNIFYMRKK